MNTLRTTISLLFVAISASAGGINTSDADTTGTFSSHLSYELRYNPGIILSTDQYVKKWLKDKNMQAFVAEVHYNTTPLDGNDYDKAYNYPRLSAGLRYSLNDKVTMHREEDPDWGQLVPVDYVTHMGNNLTLYGTFERPLLRGRQWDAGVYFGTGIGYSRKKYNKTDQIDNELIGSHLNIFFTAGAVATWYVSRHWGLRGGIDFCHHSNGALHRPNKGANYLGPFVGLTYIPEDIHQHNEAAKAAHVAKSPADSTSARFRRYWFMELTAGVGGKTAYEDWARTQFSTPPDQPDYRTDHFRMYAAYSLQADLMLRYSRLRASGIGLDLFYGTYSDHIKKLDEASGSTVSHSPWSVGIAAKHEAFYRNLSARIGFGYYLYRHMGVTARESEKPYYERVGLHYSIPRLHNLSIGFSVNAHLFKADFTEFQVSLPVKL